MSIESKSMKELLLLHNALAAKPAGPKTFSTKAKLLDRVRALQVAQVTATKMSKKKSRASVKKSPGKTGRGIGRMVRELLLDAKGYPHGVIAGLVNGQIEGAACTANSVRWYANVMRKKGISVPARKRGFNADMDEAESTEWLKSIRVIKPARNEEVRANK